MQTVVVGMSGGVDSSVAALLLKEQGYNVIGLFMHNWEEKDDQGYCTSEGDYADVRSVCDKIGIDYYSVNFSKEYMERVFLHFLDEYKKGRTPNPDVLCNREIKFGPFVDYAKKIGADYIATGHYINIERKNNLCYLKKATDLSKDQSYFLNQLRQEQIKDVLFPLGGIHKTDVRLIAEKHGLSIAKKKDSTGICFIGERKFRDFLKNFLPAQHGKMCTIDGKEIGEHMGLMYYTIGQRRGLNIGGEKGFKNNRWFVFDKDLTKNILYVSCGEDNLLFSSGLDASELNFIPHVPKETEFDCFAKFRYRQDDQRVRVKMCGDTMSVDFYDKQRAIAYGQWVVLYDELGYMLGGGVIDKKR